LDFLTISGSARLGSSNVCLLKSISQLIPIHQFTLYQKLDALPLFTADANQAPFPKPVLHWCKALQKANGLIICTPEYLHNIPALLKNALEWVTSSGELFQKPVLAITFTPHPPRGEKAMQSLLNTLNALNARVLTQLDLYQSEVTFNEAENITDDATINLLRAAINQFT